MNPSIFADHAQPYWDNNLPAIPLVSGQKRPAIQRWQMYGDAMPTAEDRAAWLTAYASGNVGLAMGPAAGLVAIDIDSEDPAVLQVLDRVLPPSPWERVGRKGMVKVYRWSGERTARIKDDKGNMICEILSKGTQFVLPPSIHPDTKQPYTANGNLYEIHKLAPPLPANFEKVLKSALKEAGIVVSVGSHHKTMNWVAAGARDATMVGMAGLLSRAVVKGERSLQQVLAEMATWVDNFVEQVDGDPLSIEKAQSKIVEFLVKDVTSERGSALPIGWDEGLTPDDLERLGLSFTDDDLIWDTQRLLDYFSAEAERHPEPRSAGRTNAVMVALSHMARNPGLTESDDHSILSFMVETSLRTLSMTALKRDLQRLRRGDISGENHTQLAKACIEKMSEFGEVRYDAGKFFQWGGASWVKSDELAIMKTIADDFGQYPAGRKQGDHTGIFRTMKALAANPLRGDAPRGVNFANGFLTETLELVPHAPEYGMTYTLPYRYVPELAGHMPIFNQFLDDSWGADADYGDKLSALQEAIGVSLMGKAPDFQQAFLLFGRAGSGKSVLQSVIKGLLPVGSSSSIVPSDWADRFLPAEMHGKLFNFAGELSERRPIPGDVFKKVVSGEVLTVQHKNRDPFDFEPMAAHWFNSNHLPKTHDSSEGFNRRWNILEFNKRIDPSKKVIALEEQILELEREAIVAWAMQGYERMLVTGRYTEPASHLALLETMAADNNSVRRFLTAYGTSLKWGPEHKATLPALHAHYWHFMLASGSGSRVELMSFAKMMKDLSGTLPFTVEHADNMEIEYRGVGI